MLNNILLFFQYAFHEKLIRGRKNEKLFSPIFLIQYYLCVIHVAIVHNICSARAHCTATFWLDHIEHSYPINFFNYVFIHLLVRYHWEILEKETNKDV